MSVPLHLHRISLARAPRQPGQAEAFSHAEAQLRQASMQRRQTSWIPACGRHVLSHSRQI
jgi:hypothetical protein